MQSVESDKMLHASEFEYLNMQIFPDCNFDVYNNLGLSLDEEWESPSEDLCNPFLHENENFPDDIIYSLVDPNNVNLSDSDEAIIMSGEYHVLSEHAYASVEYYPPSPPSPPSSPSLPVDIWSSNEDMYRTVPPANPHRRNARRTKKVRKVSINTAARAALKRPARAMAPRKRRKIENSVETSPSSSDYEDAKSRNRDAKCTAIRVINSFNSNTKAVKSEVQRTNHNRNEKKRREVMSNMMKKVRYLVPADFYREKTEKARAKASKQKILVACQAYINYLKQSEPENVNSLKKDIKQVQMRNRHLKKKREHLKCQLIAIACRLNYKF